MKDEDPSPSDGCIAMLAAVATVYTILLISLLI